MFKPLSQFMSTTYEIPANKSMTLNKFNPSLFFYTFTKRKKKLKFVILITYNTVSSESEENQPSEEN